MCHEPRDIRNEYSSNFIEYPEHVFIGLDRDNGACILKLSIMDNQILKQWNTQKHTSTVSQKKKKKHTSTARGSEAANASVPSVSYISRTPRLSQIYTITPLSNLNGNS